MPIYDLTDLLNRYSDEYLVLDFNRMFISSTLREEAWLLEQRDNQSLIAQVVSAASAFGIQGVEPDRDLTTYSGGEQAILACLLILATIDARGLSGAKVLLHNVLDSLSQANRAKLEAHFAASRQSHKTRVLVDQADRLVEVG